MKLTKEQTLHTILRRKLLTFVQAQYQQHCDTATKPASLNKCTRVVLKINEVQEGQKRKLFATLKQKKNNISF